MNINDDTLSRIPWDREGKLISMDSAMVQAVVARGIQNSCTISEGSRIGIAIHSGQVHVGECKIIAEEWKFKQECNPDIGPVVQLVKGKKLFKYANKEGDPSGMRVLLKCCKDLILKNGLLYRKAQL